MSVNLKDALVDSLSWQSLRELVKEEDWDPAKGNVLKGRLLLEVGKLPFHVSDNPKGLAPLDDRDWPGRDLHTPFLYELDNTSREKWLQEIEEALTERELRDAREVRFFILWWGPAPAPSQGEAFGSEKEARRRWRVVEARDSLSEEPPDH